MTRRIAATAVIGWIAILPAASLNAQRVTGRVSVIVGQNAPELERFAASELCGYLNKLFDLQTQPVTALDASSSAFFSSAVQPQMRRSSHFRGSAIRGS